MTTWGPAVGATWGDYDNDGYPDLFLSSAFGRSQLFHNNGNGTFTDVSVEAGIDRPCFGMVTFFCDYDNDGWLDLVQYLWCSNDDMIHSLRHGQASPQGQPLRIYRNNRDGTFTFMNEALGIRECWGSMSGNAADLDNDGRLDLVLGNGGPQMDRSDPLVVLANDGRQFRNVTFTAGLPATRQSPRRQRRGSARRRPDEHHRRIGRYVSGRVADHVGLSSRDAGRQLSERATKGREEQS